MGSTSNYVIKTFQTDTVCIQFQDDGFVFLQRLRLKRCAFVHLENRKNWVYQGLVLQPAALA